MHSLFETTTAAAIIARVQKLSPAAPALWGKMNVSQMMAHCQAPLRAYFGDIKMKRGLIGILFGRVAKKKLFSDKPWPRGLPTAREFVVVDERSFEKEQTQLLQ